MNRDPTGIYVRGVKDISAWNPGKKKFYIQDKVHNKVIDKKKIHLQPAAGE